MRLHCSINNYSGTVSLHFSPVHVIVAPFIRASFPPPPPPPPQILHLLSPCSKGGVPCAGSRPMNCRKKWLPCAPLSWEHSVTVFLTWSLGTWWARSSQLWPSECSCGFVAQGILYILIDSLHTIITLGANCTTEKNGSVYHIRFFSAHR